MFLIRKKNDTCGHVIPHYQPLNTQIYDVANNILAALTVEDMAKIGINGAKERIWTTPISSNKDLLRKI